MGIREQSAGFPPWKFAPVSSCAEKVAPLVHPVHGDAHGIERGRCAVFRSSVAWTWHTAASQKEKQPAGVAEPSQRCAALKRFEPLNFYQLKAMSSAARKL